MRHRHVEPREPERAHALDRLLEVGREHMESHVHVVETEFGEGGVVHDRRKRVRDGVAENRDHARRSPNRAHRFRAACAAASRAIGTRNGEQLT